jgi:hypothetical protein
MTSPTFLVGSEIGGHGVPVAGKGEALPLQRRRPFVECWPVAPAPLRVRRPPRGGGRARWPHSPTGTSFRSAPGAHSPSASFTSSVRDMATMAPADLHQDLLADLLLGALQPQLAEEASDSHTPRDTNAGSEGQLV